MAKKGGKRKTAPGDVATNRQAAFRYHLLDRIEAGMVLTGSEVKALRNGSAQIKDGFASVDNGELYLHNVHIPPYAPASRDNHDPERARKLLVHRKQLDKLDAREKGFTIIPTRIYFSEGRAKVEIALAKGKDVGDKRQTIKERELKRDVERAMAERR